MPPCQKQLHLVIPAQPKMPTVFHGRHFSLLEVASFFDPVGKLAFEYGVSLHWHEQRQLSFAESLYHARFWDSGLLYSSVNAPLGYLITHEYFVMVVQYS